MAKNNHLMLFIKSPVIFVGLFCVFLLYGCEPTNPEGVTEKFWQTLAQGQLETSKTQTTQLCRINCKNAYFGQTNKPALHTGRIYPANV
ncbi:MAG: hypothetical protein O2966_06480 [Proteobacteria bacterium]|nr:hypothetical protein [Pseudomonadota bacterium]